MKFIDAVNILKLAGEFTPQDVKNAYRRAAKQYHPDRNPAGSEIMKAVNEAYETLKGLSGKTSDEVGDKNYPDSLNKALNAILNLKGLEIEICGSWVWVTGDTKTHKKALNDAGYRWAPKKKAWHFRPDDWKSNSRGRLDMEKIRDIHGSTKVAKKTHKHLKGNAA